MSHAADRRTVPRASEEDFMAAKQLMMCCVLWLRLATIVQWDMSLKMPASFASARYITG